MCFFMLLLIFAASIFKSMKKHLIRLPLMCLTEFDCGEVGFQCVAMLKRGVVVGLSEDSRHLLWQEAWRGQVCYGRRSDRGIYSLCIDDRSW